MYECCFPSRQVSRRVLQCEASFTSAGRVSAETWISVCVWIVIHWNADVPTILRERGYRFFFYMADRLEPPHIHVTRGDDAAKLWLDPLEFAFVEGFRRHECNDILRMTEAHLDEFRRAWFQTFGGFQS